MKIEGVQRETDRQIERLHVLEKKTVENTTQNRCRF